MKILYLTSIEPYKSGGLAQNAISALRDCGHRVDVLTRHNYKGMPDYVSCVEKRNVVNIRSKLSKIGWLLKIYLAVKKRLVGDNRIINNGIRIDSYDENNPEVKVEDVVRHINSQYDMVIVSFMKGMLSVVTLKAIYDKLHCPIIIGTVDQVPFTGGCWFSVDCDHYKTECGCCPALNSNDPNDQTHINYLAKKEAYAGMNYVLMANGWMLRFAKDSKLFEDRRLLRSYIYINEEKFIEKDRNLCKRKFGFKDTDIVFIVRFQLTKNKGLDICIDALNDLYNRLDDEKKANLVVSVVGVSSEHANDLKTRIRFRTKLFSTVDIDKLIDLYNAADFFISPSISDAGPSMVNQSIMCGTPVVCFNIGTAIDVIQDGVNGWKTDQMDAQNLADSLLKSVSMTQEDYLQMRSMARQIAQKYQSKSAYIEKINQAFEMAKSFEKV